MARSAAELSKFSAVELLRDGRSIEIRALSPDDRADLVAAVGRTSARSLYRRFFGLRRYFSQKEIDFFLNIDFCQPPRAGGGGEGQRPPRNCWRRALRRGASWNGRGSVHCC